MVKVIFKENAVIPVLECCQCRRPIVLDGEGGDINRKTAKALFKRDGTVTFAHQTCDDDGYEMWEPIDKFVYRLLHNTGLTQKRLRQAMQFDFWGTSVKKSAVGATAPFEGVHR